jgi:Uma2 family endonuclease
VPGRPRDYVAAHPSCPSLVLEVAEATLSLDRNYKSSLYARAQIPDYWLVNVVDQVLEIYRNPALDSDAPYEWQYATVSILRGGDFVTPLAANSARIPVADLLP